MLQLICDYIDQPDVDLPGPDGFSKPVAKWLLAQVLPAFIK